MAEETTTQSTTEPNALQVPTTLKGLVEALIFAAREPLSIKQIQSLYEDQEYDGNGGQRRIEPAEISQIVEELNNEFESGEKAYRIIQIAGGYQFATVSMYAEWLGKLYKEQSRRRLSQSSIESLAIIAYRQPISKPEIESIRGVNCDYVLKTLLEKELVTIVGRAPTPGRPLLYGTTKEFLKHFGLNEITDLPRPREIEEILGESQFEAERRMLEAQQGLDQPRKEEEEFKSRLPHIPKRKAGLDESVKIVPKKQTRELKIRTDERAQEKLQLDLPAIPGPSTAGGIPVEPVSPAENEQQTVISPGAESEGLTDLPQPIPPLDGATSLGGPQSTSLERLQLDLASIPPDVAPSTTHEGEGEDVSLGDDMAKADLPAGLTASTPDTSLGISLSVSEHEQVGPKQVFEQLDSTEGRDARDSEEPKPVDIAPPLQVSKGQISLPDVAEISLEAEATSLSETSQARVGRVPIEDESMIMTKSHDSRDSSQDEIKGEVPSDVVSPGDLTKVDSIDGKVLDFAVNGPPSPPIEQSAEELAGHPQATQDEDPEKEFSSTHPKSKWQSWKEKIQGFIKKLFG